MAPTLGSIARKHFAKGLFVNFFRRKGQKAKKTGHHLMPRQTTILQLEAESHLNEEASNKAIWF